MNNQPHLVRVTLNSKADKPVDPHFWIELEFGVLVFVEEGKPENPEKNPQSRGENQHRTQPTCDTGSGNWTWATTVAGECSHHCTIPAQSVTSRIQDYTSDLLKGCIK